MKYLISILFSFLSLFSMGQTSMTFTTVSGDFIAAGKGPQYWNTADWDGTNVPLMPAGNKKWLNGYQRFNTIDFYPSGTTPDFTAFDNFVKKCIDSGAMYSFGVMAMCSYCGVGYSGYPTFAHTAMQAEATNNRDWQTGDGTWVPAWNSNSWKSFYTTLMRAIANHIAVTSYKGHTFTQALCSVDIRYYGDFGEGHTYPWTGTEPTGRTVTSAYLDAMCDSMKVVFPHVPLIAPMGYSDHNHDSKIPYSSGYKILTDKNTWGEIGIRMDNLGDVGYAWYLDGSSDSYNPGDSVHNFKYIYLNKWKKAPFGGEPAHDAAAIQRYCGTDMCGFASEISEFGISFFGNGNYPVTASSSPNLVRAMQAASLQSGFRYRLTTGSRSTSVATGGIFSVSVNWQNIGVSPTYEAWNVVYQLRDHTTHALAWFTTSFLNLRSMLPGGTTTDAFSLYLTGVSAGTYDLYLTVNDPAGYKAPLQLAITGRQSDGSFLLSSSIVVSGATPPPPITTSCGANCIIGFKYSKKVP